MVNINLAELSRNELLSLQGEIKAKLKTFRPYRIKSRVVQCNVPGCWCSDGPDGHGPYLYVTYRDDGKTKQKALGPQFDQIEFDEWDLERPDFFLCFPINPDVYEKMSVEDAERYIYCELSDQDFYERYGVRPEDDRFGRYRRFYGLREDYEWYQTQLVLYKEGMAIPSNKWAAYGVGTLSGIAILEQLEKKGYYLKE